MRCPCRKKSETETYAACCQPLHLGVRAAETAEALMRSRFAAYVLQIAPYIRATWHPSTRPAHFEFTPGQVWLQLQIGATSTAGNTATVEFTARSRVGGRTLTMHETSRFMRENGQWFYVDGVVR
jgi:SEC-C motif domain protein